ncbi:subunit of TIM23 translocase complex [Cladochytrium tenue]|nr:subunit of TIM23 translocase complex [Cladochytrium tenue]
MDASSQRWAMVERMKMGFVMGGITGMSIGFLSGAFTVLRFGPGERGYLATVGSQMLQSGGFFAFLMSIGSLLRTEEGPASVTAPPSLRLTAATAHHLPTARTAPLRVRVDPHWWHDAPRSF